MATRGVKVYTKEACQKTPCSSHIFEIVLFIPNPSQSQKVGSFRSFSLLCVYHLNFLNDHVCFRFSAAHNSCGHSPNLRLLEVIDQFRSGFIMLSVSPIIHWRKKNHSLICRRFAELSTFRLQPRSRCIQHWFLWVGALRIHLRQIQRTPIADSTY